MQRTSIELQLSAVQVIIAHACTNAMADDKSIVKRKKKSQEYIDDSDDPQDTGVG